MDMEIDISIYFQIYTERERERKKNVIGLMGPSLQHSCLES